MRVNEKIERITPDTLICGIGEKFIEYCNENKMDEIRVTVSFKNIEAI